MVFEVEQKYRVTQLSEVESRLMSLGVSLSDPIEQVDRYFNHPSRDFAETDEALRIRSVGNVNRVTYKGPKIDQTTKTRRELELPLADGTETALGYAELFTALGFSEVREVRKSRRSAQLTRGGGQFEVVLDEVDGLGTFVELEQTVAEEDVERAKQALAELAGELGLDGVERRSYLEMLLES
jgi:adenylate cyclase class 2